MIKTIEMDLQYQPIIMSPPVTDVTLFGQACSSDKVTVDTWRNKWLENMRENKKHFGSFKDKSIGKLYGKYDKMPAICAGSGPSLAENCYKTDEQKAKEKAEKISSGYDIRDRANIPLLSCLHNYHYFEDRGIKPEYYVTLDCQDITHTEVYEGGTKTPDEYFESTKDKTLLAFIGANPKLLKAWQGEVLFFNSPLPEMSLIEEVDKIEKFITYVSNGGTVLGACLYIARAFLGCNPIAFVGANFAFSYTRKFYGWGSQFDGNIGHVVGAIDVYGNRVMTWQSYFNFKSWFDWVSRNIPGLYYNCTEGGIMGAYPEGNINTIVQLPLDRFIKGYRIYEEIEAQAKNPIDADRTLLF